MVKLTPVAAAPDRGGEDRAGTNQGIPSLVARWTSALHAQNDPDVYSYSGGLNRANQGILEFVEMFKAPIKMLHRC